MFFNASSFNHDIISWDVSSVENMQGMFAAAAAFIQDLSSWNLSSARDLSFMFSGATVFNQNLCNWGSTLSSDANVVSMFDNTSCLVTDQTDMFADVPGPFCYLCN